MKCPICAKQSEKKYRPFCSSRCANVDLGRWFNGSYATPAVEDDAPEMADLRPPQDDETRH